ncbi:hypothetical protein YTPLAS21_02960 [Candidatus Nitrosocosmicus sp.]|nr:hypothetical protein YTPLAS21_02960 [Candidatus Nitrosocosmicus sp.]
MALDLLLEIQYQTILKSRTKVDAAVICKDSIRLGQFKQVLDHDPKYYSHNIYLIEVNFGTLS